MIFGTASSCVRNKANAPVVCRLRKAVSFAESARIADIIREDIVRRGHKHERIPVGRISPAEASAYAISFACAQRAIREELRRCIKARADLQDKNISRLNPYSSQNRRKTMFTLHDSIFTSSVLELPRVRHAFSTRLGGVSTDSATRSMNVAPGHGDTPCARSMRDGAEAAPRSRGTAVPRSDASEWRRQTSSPRSDRAPTPNGLRSARTCATPQRPLWARISPQGTS